MLEVPRDDEMLLFYVKYISILIYEPIAVQMSRLCYTSIKTQTRTAHFVHTGSR